MRRFESSRPSQAFRPCRDFLLFSWNGRKVNGLRCLKESLLPSGGVLTRFPGRYWGPVSVGPFPISRIFAVPRRRPVRNEGDSVSYGSRRPTDFDRLRRERSQRDPIEAHDQKAADAMEPVDCATFPRRAHRRSQQNAQRFIQATISCLSSRERLGRTRPFDQIKYAKLSFPVVRSQASSREDPTSVLP
jgi:hypothetical protein